MFLITFDNYVKNETVQVYCLCLVACQSNCYCKDDSSLPSFGEEMLFFFQSGVMANGKRIMVKISFRHCAWEKRRNIDF